MFGGEVEEREQRVFVHAKGSACLVVLGAEVGLELLELLEGVGFGLRVHDWV